MEAWGARLDVAIDTETTGLGHAAGRRRPDAVVQVGIAWRRPGRDIETWQSVCNPGVAYLAHGRADGALAVNGLTKETILAAPAAEVVARELRRRLLALANETGRPIRLLAFNRAFDQPFLEIKPWRIPRPTWGPCIMEAAAARLGGRHGLASAIRTFGLRWPDGPAHTAAVDAHAALMLHEALALESRRATGALRTTENA